MNRSSSDRCRTASRAKPLICTSSSLLAFNSRRVRAASSTALAFTSRASALASSISDPYLSANAHIVRSKSRIFSLDSLAASFCFMPRLAKSPSISRRRSSSRLSRRFSCASDLARDSLVAVTSVCSFSSDTMRRFCSNIRFTPESYLSSMDASVRRFKSSNLCSHSRVSFPRSAMSRRSPSAAFWSNWRRRDSHSSLFAVSLASTFS